MKTDIVITSYNKPAYLEQLLASLRAQHSGSYRIADIHLFQDGPKPGAEKSVSDAIDDCIKLFEAAFPAGIVHASPANLGINGNWRRKWRRMRASDADAFVMFDHDLVVSPHYLNIMHDLIGYAAGRSNIGFVSAMGLLASDREHRMQRRRALMPMYSLFGINRWGIGATRALIREMYSFVELYFDLAERVQFADNGEQPPPHAFPNLLEFYNTMGMFDGRQLSSVDAMYDLAALRLNKLHLSTYANFGKNVGEEGAHYDKAMFEDLGHHRTEIMEERVEDFDWYDDERILRVLTLVSRYIANYGINYNTGKFKLEPPFIGVDRTDLLRMLYESVFGWPITMHDFVAHGLLPYCSNLAAVPPDNRAKQGEPKGHDAKITLLDCMSEPYARYRDG